MKHIEDKYQNNKNHNYENNSHEIHNKCSNKEHISQKTAKVLGRRNITAGSKQFKHSSKKKRNQNSGKEWRNCHNNLIDYINGSVRYPAFVFSRKDAQGN